MLVERCKFIFDSLSFLIFVRLLSGLRVGSVLDGLRLELGRLLLVSVLQRGVLLSSLLDLLDDLIVSFLRLESLNGSLALLDVLGLVADSLLLLVLKLVEALHERLESLLGSSEHFLERLLLVGA